jgi:hypothetical protein
MLALTRTLGQSTGIAIIGAIWAALTLNHPESSQVASATDAPAVAQVSALQSTFLFTASIILLALGLALWALIKERRMSAAVRNREKEPKIAD